MLIGTELSCFGEKRSSMRTSPHWRTACAGVAFRQTCKIARRLSSSVSTGSGAQYSTWNGWKPKPVHAGVSGGQRRHSRARSRTLGSAQSRCVGRSCTGRPQTHRAASHAPLSTSTSVSPQPSAGRSPCRAPRPRAQDAHARDECDQDARDQDARDQCPRGLPPSDASSSLSESDWQPSASREKSARVPFRLVAHASPYKRVTAPPSLLPRARLPPPCCASLRTHAHRHARTHAHTHPLTPKAWRSAKPSHASA
eukprot:2941560-Pleurochrysis_carterae.AAC.2